MTDLQGWLRLKGQFLRTLRNLGGLLATVGGLQGR